MADFQDKQTNAGSGGAFLPTVDVVNPTTGHTDSFPVGALAYASSSADATGVMQGVDPTHGLPVQIVAALPAGTNSIGTVVLGAGSAVVGHVITDAGSVVQASQSGAWSVSISGAVSSSQGAPTSLANAWPVVITDGAHLMPTGDASARSIHTTLDNATLAVTQSGTWSLAANQSVNLAQVAGATTSVNRGAADGGTQRVAIAKDGSVLTHSRLSTPDTNLVSVKTSAGTLRRIEAFNTGAAPAYLRIYNKASAPIIASDGASIIRREVIPGNTACAGFFADYVEGIPFSAGLAYDITAANGDADATAIAANQVTVNIDYF